MKITGLFAREVICHGDPSLSHGHLRDFCLARREGVKGDSLPEVSLTCTAFVYEEKRISPEPGISFLCHHSQFARMLTF